MLQVCNPLSGKHSRSPFWSLAAPALFFLIPPTAAVMAWVLIGEAMPASAWLGMVLAAAGVAVANRRPSHTRKV